MHPISIALAIILLLGAALPAQAQSAATDRELFACSSQQELEQTIQSEGAITPDGCWTVTVNSLTADGEDLCLLNFASGDGNILGQLQDAAMPSEWWIRCDELAAAAAAE